MRKEEKQLKTANTLYWTAFWWAKHFKPGQNIQQKYDRKNEKKRIKGKRKKTQKPSWPTRQICLLVIKDLRVVF